MKLILLINTDGERQEICDCPPSVLSSRAALSMFLRTHASRLFGKREGTDWRVCMSADRNALIPLSVNQVIVGTDGKAEYGQQLVIE